MRYPDYANPWRQKVEGLLPGTVGSGELVFNGDWEDEKVLESKGGCITL